MSIHFDEPSRRLTLRTETASYQMQIDDLGYLRHLYYGRDAGEQALTYFHRQYDLGFSGNPYERRWERTNSPD